MILSEAPLRFVLKVFSVLRRWRARYTVPSSCSGHTVVQNLTPDVASTLSIGYLWRVDTNASEETIALGGVLWPTGFHSWIEVATQVPGSV